MIAIMSYSGGVKLRNEEKRTQTEIKSGREEQRERRKAERKNKKR